MPDEKDTESELNVGGGVVVSLVGITDEVIELPVKIDGIIVVSETV